MKAPLTARALQWKMSKQSFRPSEASVNQGRGGALSDQTFASKKRRAINGGPVLHKVVNFAQAGIRR
jgi:hypothetical protein